MKYEVDFHDGFFEVKTSGDGEPDGFGEFLDHMFAHEKWKPGTSFLANHSALNSGPLSVDDVRRIAKVSVERKAQLGKARCAILVSRDLEYGLARMWEVFVEDRWEVIEKIFRSREEAISWLKEV